MLNPADVATLAKEQRLIAARQSLICVCDIAPNFADDPQQMHALIAAIDAIKAYITELENQHDAAL